MTEILTTLPALKINHSRKNIESFLKGLATVLSVGDYVEQAYSISTEDWQGEVESAKVKLDDKTILEIRLVRAR